MGGSIREAGRVRIRDGLCGHILVGGPLAVATGGCMEQAGGAASGRRDDASLGPQPGTVTHVRGAAGWGGDRVPQAGGC